MDSVKCWHRLRRVTTDLLIGCLLAFSLPIAAQPAPDPTPEPAPALEPLTPPQSSGRTPTGTVLDDFVREVHDLTADFVQKRYDADGELYELATGRMALLRPNHFLWHADTPFELVLVTNGELLWKYDVEFEQVSRRPFADFAASPAMLLSGDADIDASFRVDEIGAFDGLRWIELAPREGQSGDFASAKIGFRGNVPVALEFVDGLSEITRIDFEAIELNTGLAPALFDFEPPAGVDIVDD